MTKQEMWDLINKENTIKEEINANIVATEKNINDLQNKIEIAIRKKDSAAAIEFSEQLEAERRKLEIYRDVKISYEYGVNISKDDFMECFSEEVSIPYYKRLEELKTELLEQRESYITKMKAAYNELRTLEAKEGEFWNINSKGNLDIDIPTFYPKRDLRDCFINESQYFWEG